MKNMEGVPGFIVEVRPKGQSPVHYLYDDEQRILKPDETFVGYFYQIMGLQSESDIMAAHIQETVLICPNRKQFRYGGKAKFILDEVVISVRALRGHASNNRFLPEKYDKYETWEEGECQVVPCLNQDCLLHRPMSHKDANMLKPPTCSRGIRRLCRMVDLLTVPSADNGYEFTDRTRLNLIEQMLAKSNAYVPFADKPLAKIYRHNGFDAARPYCLVSCHVDSVYENYFSDSPSQGDSLGGSGRRAWESLGRGGLLDDLPAPDAFSIWDMEDDSKDYYEIRGTYDNAVCNATLLDSLMRGGLPPQVLVAFTGNEERGLKGVDQTVACLEERSIRDALEFVCVMDLTEEAYGRHPITIENTFVNEPEKLSDNFPGGIFDEFGIRVPVIEDAAPDESWQYDEHDCNCFSLCLPCRLLGYDMHEDAGVAVRLDSLFLYQRYVSLFFKKWGNMSNLTAPTSAGCR